MRTTSCPHRTLLKMGAVVGGALAFSPLLASAQPTTPAPASVEEDGTVHLPAMAVPPSSFLSPQAKAYLAEHLRAMRTPRTQKPSTTVPDLPAYMSGYLVSARALFPSTETDSTIGGVPVTIFTPRGGVAKDKQDRVLVNLHGGGFASCFRGCGALESLPLSGQGGYKVVSVDYRQGPRYRFPAASEDVAAVYTELLKHYRAENIGIYGCSAGGLLTAMSVAWFQTHGLPRPGAIGIFCSGLAATDIVNGGDANYLAMTLGEARAPATPPPAGTPLFPEPSYLAGTDPTDPMMSPRYSSDILKKFPPTLIITGTRAMEYDAAIYGHRQLVKAGAKAELHVWNGLFHGFFYNPDVPESREADQVMIDFFDKNLGRQ